MDNPGLRQLQIRKCFIIAGVLLGVQTGYAETLSDPTRPPLGMGAPVASGDVQAQAATAGPVLQAVSLSRHRKLATISGQQVMLGGRYGDATLVVVRDSEVTLRNPDGTLETLRMHPQVEKKVILQQEARPRKTAAGRTKLGK